jgi:excisionase family DNA binding protein
MPVDSGRTNRSDGTLAPKCHTRRMRMIAKQRRMKTNDRSKRRRQLTTASTREQEPHSPETSPDQALAGVLGDYMTTEELAVELDITPLTLIRWRLEKKGPPVTRIGRRILYRRSSVKAWMAAQEEKWA